MGEKTKNPWCDPERNHQSYTKPTSVDSEALGVHDKRYINSTEGHIETKKWKPKPEFRGKKAKNSWCDSARNHPGYTRPTSVDSGAFPRTDNDNAVDNNNPVPSPIAVKAD